jgi:hypothetical protein
MAWNPVSPCPPLGRRKVGTISVTDTRFRALFPDTRRAPELTFRPCQRASGFRSPEQTGTRPRHKHTTATLLLPAPPCHQSTGPRSGFPHSPEPFQPMAREPKKPVKQGKGGRNEEGEGGAERRGGWRERNKTESGKGSREPGSQGANRRPLSFSPVSPHPCQGVSGSRS